MNIDYDNNLISDADFAVMCDELNEQARLLGMSAEREVVLLGKVERLERDNEYFRQRIAELLLFKNLVGEYGLQGIEDLAAVVRQRDELLEAAEYALPYLSAMIPEPRDGANGDTNCVKRLTKAIDSAKGGAA